MGSDKEEKKQLKAQAKLEKKKFKAQKTSLDSEPKVSKKNERVTRIETQQKSEKEKKVPWYKNPDWLRAIAGIASVIVAVIAIIISLYY